MTTIKIIRLLQLFSYLVVVSQLLFYLVIFSDAMKLIPLDYFLVLRKVVDTNFSIRFKSMYYACFLLTFILVILTAKKPSSKVFITAVIAFVCLAADMAIAVRGSMPLNVQMNQYASSSNLNWSQVREKWLLFINYRAVIGTTGFITLLCGLLVDSASK